MAECNPDVSFLPPPILFFQPTLVSLLRHLFTLGLGWMCEWAQQHHSSFWVIEFHCRCMVRETLETMNERTNTKKHSLCLDLARLKFSRILSMYSMFKRLQPAEVFEPVSSQSAVTYNHLSTSPPRQVFILLVPSFQIPPFTLRDTLLSWSTQSSFLMMMSMSSFTPSSESSSWDCLMSEVFSHCNISSRVMNPSPFKSYTFQIQQTRHARR